MNDHELYMPPLRAAKAIMEALVKERNQLRSALWTAVVNIERHCQGVAVNFDDLLKLLRDALPTGEASVPQSGGECPAPSPSCGDAGEAVQQVNGTASRAGD